MIHDQQHDTDGRFTVKHGHARGHPRMPLSPTYRVWHGMIVRCTNPNHRAYPRYGGCGRGLDDPRWLEFENFLADMGERPPGMVLERKDNKRGYSKSNCVWATWRQQNRNRGNNKLTMAKARKIRASKASLTVLAARFGVSRSLVGLIKQGKRWAE